MSLIYLLFAAGATSISYQQDQAERQRERDKQAETIRNLLVAYRQVYSQQLTTTLPAKQPIQTHPLTDVSKAFQMLGSGGVTFKNASDRPTNPNNLADGFELQAINYFRDYPGADQFQITTPDEDGTEYIYYTSPIWVTSSCLRCHGPRAKIEVDTTIDHKISKGFDYQIGDLKGVLSIRLQHSTRQPAGIPTWWITTAGYLILLLLSYGLMLWFIGRYLLSPLRQLSQIVGAYGAGEQQVHAMENGCLEIHQLARSFNQMTRSLQTRSQQIERLQGYYQALVDQNRDAMIGVDTTGTIRLFNTAAEELLGYHSRELIGQPLVTLIPSGYRQPHLEGFKRFVQRQELTHGKQAVEVQALHRDGHQIPIEITMATITTDENMMVLGALRDITHRKELEQEMALIQKGFYQAEAIAHLGHWRWEISANQLYWSTEIFNIFGVDMDHFTTTYEGFLEHVHPDDRGHVDSAVQNALHKGVHDYEIIHRVIRSDNGEQRIVHERASLERDTHGNAIRMLGIVQDITLVEQARLALQQSETQVRLLLNSTGEGIFGIDPHGSCCFCNPAAARMFGFPSAELLVGQPIHELIHHSQRDGTPCIQSVCPIFGGAASRQSAHGEDEYFWRADGSGFAVEYDIHPIRDSDGTLTGSVCVFSDITVRLATEARQTQLAAVVESAPLSIMITNSDAILEYVNRALLRQTGYQREELIGQHARIMASGKTPIETYKDLWQTIQAGRVWHGTFVNKRCNGSEIIEEAWISPIKDKHDTITHYVAVKQDVTERKHLEEKIWFQATHDDLTGLPNRNLFRDRLDRELAHAVREKSSLGLLFIDLDGFKAVNDTQGHEMGDLLLRQVAARIEVAVRDSDTVSRLGGDEFTVILPRVQSRADAMGVADKVLEALRRPFPLRGWEARISGSIGVALFPDDAKDTESLLNRADDLMYRVKDRGRNGILTTEVPED